MMNWFQCLLSNSTCATTIWRDAVPDHDADAGEGLMWRVDHRGEESLAEESRLGRGLQVEPIKPKLKPSGTKRVETKK